jgi:hypothetical protein
LRRSKKKETESFTYFIQSSKSKTHTTKVKKNQKTKQNLAISYELMVPNTKKSVCARVTEDAVTDKTSLIL